MRGNRRGARRILAGGLLRVLLVAGALGAAYLTFLAPAAAAGPCHVVTSSDLGTKNVGEPVTVSQSGPQGGSFSSYSGSISWGDGATTPISGGVGSWSHTYSTPGSYSIRTTGSGAYGPPTTSCSDDITQTVRIVGPSAGLCRRDVKGCALPKSKTNCKKNGKRVLCPAQKKLNRTVATAAANMGTMLKQYRESQEKAAIAEQKKLEFIKKMQVAAEQLKKKERVGVPENVQKTLDAQTKIVDIWKLFKLPEKERGAAAKQMAGNQTLEFFFGKEADKTLSQNDQLLKRANDLYAADPEVANLLNLEAGYFNTGVPFDRLPPSEQLKVAAGAAKKDPQNRLGSQFEYTNNAVDLGIAGLKFTLTTKGAKL